MKHIFVSIIVTFLVLLAGKPAFAHVQVQPSEVGVGSFQTFSLGVPNEKDNPTVAIRLEIPQVLQHVSPHVKPGWTISEQKDNGNVVTQIAWTNGSIPSGQRDDFLFSAQVPGNETVLQWKVSQTYADGTIVNWIQNPSAAMGDDEKVSPYSETKVVNDLAGKSSEDTTPGVKNPEQWSVQISIVAIALSALSIGLQLRKRM